jgi:hypothetical protein
MIIASPVKLAILAGLCFFVSSSTANPGKGRHKPTPTPTPIPIAKFAWDANPVTTDPNTNTVGYRLWLGFTSGGENTAFDVGNVVAYTLTLSPSTHYYFFVTAYNLARIDSLPSNEINLITP